jgi:hypothetical protein
MKPQELPKKKNKCWKCRCNCWKCRKSKTTIFVKYESRNTYTYECNYWIHKSYQNRFDFETKEYLNAIKWAVMRYCTDKWHFRFSKSRCR